MIRLTCLAAFDPFVVIVNAIGADPADVPAVPFDLELSTKNILGKIFHRIIVFGPVFALGFFGSILFFPGSVPVFPFSFHREPTYIVLNVGFDHIAKNNVVNFYFHHLS